MCACAQVLWGLFAIKAVLSLSVAWLMIILTALVLSCSNVIGYFKCRKGVPQPPLAPQRARSQPHCSVRRACCHPPPLLRRKLLCGVPSVVERAVELSAAARSYGCRR